MSLVKLLPSVCKYGIYCEILFNVVHKAAEEKVHALVVGFIHSVGTGEKAKHDANAAESFIRSLSNDVKVRIGFYLAFLCSGGWGSAQLTDRKAQGSKWPMENLLARGGSCQ